MALQRQGTENNRSFSKVDQGSKTIMIPSVEQAFLPDITIPQILPVSHMCVCLTSQGLKTWKIGYMKLEAGKTVQSSMAQKTKIVAMSAEIVTSQVTSELWDIDGRSYIVCIYTVLADACMTRSCFPLQANTVRLVAYFSYHLANNHYLQAPTRSPSFILGNSSFVLHSDTHRSPL